MSSKDLLDLLPEVLDCIFKFCRITDLLNFAECSTQAYAAVRHVMWESLKIPWGDLDSLQRERERETGLLRHRRLPSLENVRFALSLHFSACAIHYIKTKSFADIAVKYNELVQHCNPTKVTRLHLDGIINDDGIRHTCETLTNIRELMLSFCFRLTDDGMGSLARLRHLTKLSIENSRIKDSGVEKLANIPNLTELQFTNCPCLTSSSLPHLSNIKLTKLYITKAKRMFLTGNGDIEKLKSLTNLSLCRANIVDLTFKEFALSLRNLEQLKLTGCKHVTDEAIELICQLPSLRYLSVISCIGVSNAGLRFICAYLRLMKLSVCGNFNISDEGFRDISKLGTLTKLDCSWTGITDAAMASIGGLVNLRHLNLSGCKVTDKGLLKLTPLKCLNVLLIAHCDSIVGFGLHNLNFLNTLAELDIRYCVNIDDEVLSNLYSMKWRNLRIV